MGGREGGRERREGRKEREGEREGGREGEGEGGGEKENSLVLSFILFDDPVAVEQGLVVHLLHILGRLGGLKGGRQPVTYVTP